MYNLEWRLTDDMRISGEELTRQLLIDKFVECFEKDRNWNPYDIVATFTPLSYTALCGQGAMPAWIEHRMSTGDDDCRELAKTLHDHPTWNKASHASKVALNTQLLIVNHTYKPFFASQHLRSLSEKPPIAIIAGRRAGNNNLEGLVAWSVYSTASKSTLSLRACASDMISRVCAWSSKVIDCHVGGAMVLMLTINDIMASLRQEYEDGLRPLIDVPSWVGA